MKSKKKLNRRQFIGAVGAGVAVTGCATHSPLPELFPPSAAELPSDSPSPPVVGSEETTASPGVEASEVHAAAALYPGLDTKTILLNRITYGPRLTDVAEINSLGYNPYIERQLNPNGIDDSQMTVRLSPFTSLNASAAALSGMDLQQVTGELAAASIMRAVHSKRQLLERMVEFWSDHFNVFQFSGGTWAYKTVEDREVIRQFALGKFKDLLRASAKSPAMLRYLNGDQNRAGRPNENYAREVMELHTLGPGAGYVQRDVQDMARAMTGWTVGTSGANLHNFQFRPDYHDYSAKQIMGLSLAALPPGSAAGITDGERALDYLAAHTATSQHIAGKLVAFFVSEDRPQGLVDQAALMFRLTGGDIKSVLRAILGDAAMRLATVKLKRPFHLFSDVARRSGINLIPTTFLPVIPGSMGHRPFSWSTPDGYPQRSDYWGSALLSRWNIMTILSNGNTEGVPLYPQSLALAGGATTTVQVVELWNQKFFGGRMSAADRQLLTNYMNQAPNDAWRRYNESFALALSLPAFQYH